MAAFCRYIFFFILLLIGLMTFKDYGVHRDEYYNQSRGDSSLQYVINIKHNRSIARTTPLQLDNSDLIHGSFVELSLALLKRILHLTDSRDILLMRHLVCFLLFFMGVYLFYLLCDLHFNNWKIALIGSLFLVLSPRIFANAFYDTYDIPFLSFYIFSMYTLLRWLRERSLLNASLHALSCALLIDTRPIGMIMPLFTFLLFFVDVLREPALRIKINATVQFLFYVGLLAILIVLGWPILWPHPLTNFITVLHANFHLDNPISTTTLFFGRELIQEGLPWYYAPVWILITTPVLYIFFFVIGFFAAIKSILKNSLFALSRDNILFILCFLFPLCLTMGKIYNTWRHIFFIYPAFLMISLGGLSALWEGIKNRFNGNLRLFAQGLIILISALSLCTTSYFMVRNHPFGNIYFNSFAGKDMQEIKGRFDLDYWGLPYKQGLESLVKKDTDRIITVSSGIEYPEFISYNISILPARDRARFQVADMKNAKYFITNYRWHPQEYPYPLYDSIKIGNAKIFGIYKLR
jgi:hypothetical protein